MLEIYNEQVRDLLSKECPKGGLQVRQNPKLGYFYVQDLKKVPVGSYSEIEKRMEQGQYHLPKLTIFSNTIPWLKLIHEGHNFMFFFFMSLSVIDC